MNKNNELVLVSLLSLLLIYIIVMLPVHWMIKLGLGIASMYGVGQYLITKHGFNGEHGIVLLKSQCGLGLIKRLSEYEGFWKFFSEVGTVASYGAFAFVILPKPPSLKSVLCGFLLLTVLIGFVGPFVLPFLVNSVGINVGEKSIKKSVDIGKTGGDLFFIIPLILLYGGGIFAIILSSIVLYGAIVLVALQNSIFLGTNEMALISPGVAPLLPGINLPLVESIIALLVILVVHEGAHAILGYIARVPILSSGVVLFGVIPIGAFIEPDEKVLKKVPRAPQTAVIIAGSTANLVASVLFFMLFLGFIYLTKPTFEKGFPAAVFAQPWMTFVYMTLGLCFTLNFAIGTVNLLPLPFFDGYRALEINIKNKIIVDIFMAITVLSFLVNMLPWLFR